MMKGYVTQGSHSGHIAVDLSSDNKAEPIYAIAEGPFMLFIQMTVQAEDGVLLLE